MNIYMIPVLLLLALLISGCDEVSDLIDQEINSKPEVVDASTLNGLWVGQYECAQGLTGISLSITGDGEAVDAVLSFYGIVENPDKPFGSAKYAGSYDLENNLSLSGVEWINQPSGYSMEPLSGKVNVSEGVISASLCGKNSTLNKSQPPVFSKIVGEWVGTYACAQGETGIVLSIREENADLSATFDFFGLPTKSGTPFGSFSLSGVFDSVGNVDLQPDSWINQPSGWGMVGVEGRLGENESFLNAKVCGNNAVMEKVGQPISSEAINGDWIGSYTCAQGETGLTLNIEGEGKNVTANFSFYEVSENPGVPSGNFEMKGIYNGSDIIDLEPTEWISRPSGYNYIGFEAHINTVEGTLSGKLCGTDFNLEKE